MPDELGLSRKQIEAMAHEGFDSGKLEIEIVQEITLGFSRYFRPAQMPAVQQRVREIVSEVRASRARFETRWSLRERKIKKYHLPKEEEKALLDEDKKELMLRYLGEEETNRKLEKEKRGGEKRKARKEKIEKRVEQIRRAKLTPEQKFTEDLASGKMFKVNALPILILIIAAIASFYILQQPIIFVGFLAWAFYFLIPDVDPKYRNIAWTVHSIKALFKIGVIFAFSFVFSFREIPFIPAQVPISLAIAIFGYFLLHKSEVDLLQPGEIVESLASLLLVILTVILIIFNFSTNAFGGYAWLLACVYMAFFFVIPQVKQLKGDDKKELDKADEFSRWLHEKSSSKVGPVQIDIITVFNRGLFAVLFTIAFIIITSLVGVGDFSLTSISIFIGIFVFLLSGVAAFAWSMGSTNGFWLSMGAILLFFFVMIGIGFFDPSILIGGLVWLVLLFIGLTSPDETRPYLGIFAFILAFFIFSFTVGGEVVGQAFFGEFWPTVQDFTQTNLAPIKDAVKDAFKSFGQIFKLVSNPAGYARDIVEGIYVNPTTRGSVGAYGLKIEDFSLEKVVLLRPFTIALALNNLGASDAKNVVTDMQFSGKDASDFSIEPKLPVSETSIEQESPKDYLFRGEISCDTVRKHDLGKKYIIPLNVTTSYDYHMDSKLELEFVSQAERERRVKAKTLQRVKKQSEISASPAALAISMDLYQPVGSDEPFFVDFKLEPKESGGVIDNAIVETTFPPEFFDPKAGELKCISRKGEIEPTTEGGVKWAINEKIPEEGLVLTCNFKDGIKLDKPSKTFLVTAKTDFRFTSAKSKSLKFQFGSSCCTGVKESCPEELFCLEDGGSCVEKEGEIVTVVPPFDTDHCSNKLINNLITCNIGEGNCKDKLECSTDDKYSSVKGEMATDLDCIQIPEWQNLGVCCPESATIPQCKAAYLEFRKQVNRGIATHFDSDSIYAALLAARTP